MSRDGTHGDREAVDPRKVRPDRVTLMGDTGSKDGPRTVSSAHRKFLSLGDTRSGRTLERRSQRSRWCTPTRSYTEVDDDTEKE